MRQLFYSLCFSLFMLLFIGLLPTSCSKSGSPSSPSGSHSNTNTPTVTSTPTNLNGWTSTPTSTPTATATSCNPTSYLPQYTFDSNLECWQTWTNGATINSLDISSVVFHNGTGSLHTFIQNAAATQVLATLEIVFGTPQDLTGKQITAWAYVDAGLTASNWATYLQLVDQTGPNWSSAVWEGGSQTPLNAGNNTGQWIPLTLVVGSGMGSVNPSQVLELGVSLNNIPAGAAGNFYIDEVQISNLPTPTYTSTATLTPTPSPTLAPGAPTYTPTLTSTSIFTPTSTATFCAPNSVLSSYTFDNSLECWHPWTNTDTGINLDISNSIYHNGGGALDASVTYMGTTMGNGSILIWYGSTQNLTGKEIIAWVMADSSLVANGNTYINILCQSILGGPTTQVENGSSIAPVAGINSGLWIPVTVVPGSSGGDPSQIISIGIGFWGMSPGGSGNLYIDDVQIINAPPTATPTTTPTITRTPTITWTPTITLSPTATTSPTPTITVIPPTAPTNLSAVECCGNQLCYMPCCGYQDINDTLSWDPVSNCTGYIVYIGSSCSSAASWPNTVTGTSINNVLGMCTSTGYFFVKAYNGGGESAPSTCMQFTY